MFAVNLPNKNLTERHLGPEGISNLRSQIDNGIPVPQEDIDLMYDEISKKILSDIDSNSDLKSETAENIRTAVPFEATDMGPDKDGESVKPEVVDKSESKEDIEKERAELREQIEHYNEYVQEALDAETKIKDLGDQAGIAKDEIIAAIVNVEDPFFHPATPGLVRSRLLTERSRIAGGDDKLSQLKEQCDQKLGSLASLGEKIEAVREQINSLFKSMLSACRGQKEVADLRDFINEIRFYDQELQILQRDEVEARYRDMKEGLGADCAARMVEISKTNKSIKETVEEPVPSVIERKPKESTDQTQAIVQETTGTGQGVGFETFVPNQQPVVETGAVQEDKSFGPNQDIKLPGVTEGSIENEQKIAKIQEELKEPPLQMPTSPQDADTAKPEGTSTGEGVEQIADLEGHTMEVDYQHPQDGAGVTVNAPEKVATEESTLPEAPTVAENQTVGVSTDQPAPEAQVQTPIQPEVPVVASPEQSKEVVSSETPVKEKQKGGIGAFLGRFLKKNHDPTSNEAAELDKMVTEERKEAGTAQQE